MNKYIMQNQDTDSKKTCAVSHDTQRLQRT